MERLILSDWPRTQEESQVRKLQFMALVERPASRRAAEKRDEVAAPRALRPRVNNQSFPRLYLRGAPRAPNSYQSNWILFWQADWSVRN
jgi:hypothetical protein